VPTVVVLDANVLMLPFERNVRIEEELERLLGPFSGVVPETVLKELATIAAKAKGRQRENARMALAFASRFKFAESHGKADKGVLEVAKALGAVLFTNDRELLASARGAGLRTVRLRGLSHLELDPN
jgi:uncharacterized protein